MSSNSWLSVHILKDRFFFKKRVIESSVCLDLACQL